MLVSVEGGKKLKYSIRIKSSEPYPPIHRDLICYWDASEDQTVKERNNYSINESGSKHVEIWIRTNIPYYNEQCFM